MTTVRTILELAPGALSDYYDWMKQASAGDVLVYWHGDLQYDRQVVIAETDVLRLVDRQRIAALNVIAERVFKDARDGQVLLTQRRLGTGIYEYRATRRRQMYGNAAPDVRNDNLVLA